MKSSIIIKEITEKEFDKLPDAEKVLCFESEVAHKFVLLFSEYRDYSLALCWRSSLLQPSLTTKNNLFWLGIDQQLLVIAENNFRIILNITLDSNLLELLETADLVIVRTELELYIFNRDARLQNFVYLPEVSESIVINSNILKVILTDGNNITLKI